MSIFKFNFSNEANVDQENKKKLNEDIIWLECEEIVPNKQIQDIDDLVTHAKMFVCGDVEIGHVVASEALSKMYTGNNEFKNAVELAENVHSDLVPGKYEGTKWGANYNLLVSYEIATTKRILLLGVCLLCGGLKIWECTYDLVEYLDNHNEVQFKNKRVLDLGCGAGVLGIYAFLKESHVTFQDYNKEILDCVTIPNVLLNIEEGEKTMDISKCRFYSGDWASFNDKLADTEVFDIILTSETIYNTTNYDKLIDLFLKRLSNDGEVYVAAKTCYFGVGGGTRQFETSVDKNGQLESIVCWKSSGGILREILKLTRKI